MRGTLLLVAALSLAPRASAQPGPPDPAATDVAPGGTPEPVDRTRLDVERLPPEAARAVGISRDMYDHGLFVEGQLGGQAFAGDLRRVSRAGPRFAIALGYELTRWLAIVVQAEGSLHQTSNRPPPSHTSYELLGGAAGVRFMVPLDARFALSLAGLASLSWSSRDILRALGFDDAGRLGLGYGGELGLDYHLPARHHAIGLLGGARALPSFARDGYTVGAYGAATLRYVF